MPLDSLGARRRCCHVCTRPADAENAVCGNPLCRLSGRSIARIDAVFAEGAGVNRQLKALKYQNRLIWAAVFGRSLVEHLDRHHLHDEFDLIVANPTCISGGGRKRTRHTEIVIDAAADIDRLQRWPFDVENPRAIVKLGPPARSARPGASYASKVAAADQLMRGARDPGPAPHDQCSCSCL